MKKDYFPAVSLQSCPDYALIMPLRVTIKQIISVAFNIIKLVNYFSQTKQSPIIDGNYPGSKTEAWVEISAFLSVLFFGFSQIAVWSLKRMRHLCTRTAHGIYRRVSTDSMISKF